MPKNKEDRLKAVENFKLCPALPYSYSSSPHLYFMRTPQTSAENGHLSEHTSHFTEKERTPKPSHTHTHAHANTQNQTEHIWASFLPS
jgi:hypothetical protein